MLVLRHPAHQGRLRDRRGRRSPARGARAAGRRRARARARRSGHVAVGEARLGRGEPPARRAGGARAQPRTGSACCTCSRTASRTSSWRPSRRTRCPTWTSPCSTRPAPSCAACGAPATAPPTSTLLERVRAALPGAAVRSTFITGFPGETEAEFEELEDFVREAGLAVAGVFVYDEQEGTAAAGMPDAVPQELAFERAARLGELIDDQAARFWRRPRGRYCRRPRRARHQAGRRGRRSAASPCRRPTSTDAPPSRGARARRGTWSGAVSRTPSGMMWRPSPRQGDRDHPEQDRSSISPTASPSPGSCWCLCSSSCCWGGCRNRGATWRRQPSSSSPPPRTSSTATWRGAASRSPRSGSFSTRWPTSCSSPPPSSPSWPRIAWPRGSPRSSSSARSP